MPKSTTNVKEKARAPKKELGRPKTIGAVGEPVFVGLWLSEELGNQVDAWAKRKKIAKRSEAIRRLIEQGLKG
jgi:hypothetical protein